MNESSDSVIEGVLPKSFEDLKKEVHDKGICGECGGCVSFCSASEINAIKMSEEGPPKYNNEDACLHCGICYLVCPQTHVLNDELNKKFNYKKPMGFWKKVTSARAASEDIRNRATDGGVVTSILNYLIDHNLIDGAIVCKKEGPFNRIPFFATSNEEILEAAGSHFDYTKQVVGLENYNTFIPTITKLKNVVHTDLMKIAVVGTPCQIHSIRKMQELSILPAHVVKYTLGLFCNLNFAFDDSAHKKLEEKYNFSFEQMKSMNIKEKVIINVEGKDPINIDFSELNDFVRPACFACPDFSNIYADISFGGLGSKDKYTTTLVRTDVGEYIYNSALKEGYFEETAENNTSLKKSEMLAKVISFSRRKIQRASATLEK